MTTIFFKPNLTLYVAVKLNKKKKIPRGNVKCNNQVCEVRIICSFNQPKKFLVQLVFFW